MKEVNEIGKSYEIPEGSMGAQRNIHLKSYSEIIAEIHRLQSEGYQKGGNWSLGQICSHLNYYMQGSLDGYGKKMLPWIVRVSFGNFVKKALMKTAIYKPGQMTDPDSVPGADSGESEEISKAIQSLQRLEKEDSPLHFSPLMGELSREEWNSIHINHANHHLSFLHPVQK